MALDINETMSKIVVCVYVIEIIKDDPKRKTQKLYIQNLPWYGSQPLPCHLHVAESQRQGVQ